MGGIGAASPLAADDVVEVPSLVVLEEAVLFSASDTCVGVESRLVGNDAGAAGDGDTERGTVGERADAYVLVIVAAVSSVLRAAVVVGVGDSVAGNDGEGTASMLSVSVAFSGKTVGEPGTTRGPLSLVSPFSGSADSVLVHTVAVVIGAIFAVSCGRGALTGCGALPSAVLAAASAGRGDSARGRGDVVRMYTVCVAWPGVCIQSFEVTVSL